MQVPVSGAELHVSIPFAADASARVCLVPSGMGTRPYEKQLPASLARVLQPVLVDLRGSGQSTGNPVDLSFDVLAQDLDSVRQAIGAEQVVVLGHSIMGALAVEYARRKPRSVSHLVLVGTPPSADMAALAARSAAFFEQHASPERKQALAQNLASLPSDPRERTPFAYMLAQTPQRFFDARRDVAPLFEGAAFSMAFFTHLMGKLTPGWDIQSAPLDTPLLLALGRHDYTVPHVVWDGVWESLAERVPRARRELFQSSGHQPFCEEPERFTTAVREWLAQG
jgi:proline iminopeptidase